VAENFTSVTDSCQEARHFHWITTTVFQNYSREAFIFHEFRISDMIKGYVVIQMTDSASFEKFLWHIFHKIFVSKERQYGEIF